MTLFEALKFNREPLEILIKLGIKQDDVRYIDLYSEILPDTIVRDLKNACRSKNVLSSPKNNALMGRT